jgi:heptosyltransferase-3
MKPGPPFYRLFAAATALFRRPPARDSGKTPRLLVIRRNRMGDMICTLPLLWALRRKFPQAHLAVACDAPGFPIAQACPAVDEVILLKGSWNRWLAIVKNARLLQDYDAVIAAKAGFDQRLAVLARLTNAPQRIGYETAEASSFYTDPVAISSDLGKKHQVEAMLGLFAPFGEIPAFDSSTDFRLRLPSSAIYFADKTLANGPLAGAKQLVLINLSSTSRLKFRSEDFAFLAAELARQPGVAVGLVGLPSDQARARHMAAEIGGPVVAISTPGPLELAALLQRASAFLTAEGGAAHLAATAGTPSVVLWSEGPFEKWHSRAANHVFLWHENGEITIARERVWKALAAILSLEGRAATFDSRPDFVA